MSGLPADSHVHSEWSWDAPDGSMLETCRRAVEIGLPAIAFTEHLDHTVWRVETSVLEPDDHLARLAVDGRLHPPPLDVAGYLAAVEDCRERFPGLRVLSGLELGEPHRHPRQVAAVLSAGTFDRLLGSVHSLADGDEHAEPPGLWGRRPALSVLRDYLAEVAAMAATSLDVEVVAHVDYPLRSWPGERPPLEAVEGELREVLRVIARSGRALELNTRLPTSRPLVRWWREEGGRTLSFGSDAHEPGRLAHEFRDAVRTATACGFRAGRDPWALWTRD